LGAELFVAKERQLMKRIPMIFAGLLGAVAGQAQAALDNAAAEAMMKKDGCAACHAVDRRIVGPAFVDVAAKYRGDRNAAAKLAKKVKEGGSGVWGPIMMPPNTPVATDDIEALVAWILSLKKPPSANSGK
jgi:cytochrome c